MIRLVRISEAIDQPTTIRVDKSITIAKYNHPDPVFRYVISPQCLVPGTRQAKSRLPLWSSRWFLMCSVRALGSTLVVF